MGSVFFRQPSIRSAAVAASLSRPGYVHNFVVQLPFLEFLLPLAVLFDYPTTIAAVAVWFFRALFVWQR